MSEGRLQGGKEEEGTAQETGQCEKEPQEGGIWHHRERAGQSGSSGWRERRGGLCRQLCVGMGGWFIFRM